MTLAHRYSLLESFLLRSRALNSASDAQLDAVLSEMDRVWDNMSEFEQVVANAHAAELARIPAPEDLALVEIIRAPGDHGIPRRAA